MSSYLSFFIVPKRKSKKEAKKHIMIASYSRNTDIYQYFSDNISPVFNGFETHYTSLTQEKVNTVMQDIIKGIGSARSRLTEYEKYASDNPDYIDSIIETKETIQDLECLKGIVSFIDEMVRGITFYGEIEEVCCNRD